MLYPPAIYHPSKVTDSYYEKKYISRNTENKIHWIEKYKGYTIFRENKKKMYRSIFHEKFTT